MLRGAGMTKFFERYGDWVLFIVLCIIVLAGIYGLVHFLATLQVLPGALNVAVIEGHGSIKIIVSGWTNKLQDKWPMFGAIIQAAASAFAIIQGISLMRRFLPKRLQSFIDQEMKFVYPVGANLLAAEQLVGTTDRRAMLPAPSQTLFQTRPLVRALKSLGRTGSNANRNRIWKYTPIRIPSFDDVITESDRVIEVAEKRLAALKDIKLHGHLARGALYSAKAAGKTAQSEAGARNERAEQDFTALVDSKHMNLVGLELRGLLASRDDSRFIIADNDFRAMDEAATGETHYLTRARAKRYRAELLVRQSNDRIAWLTNAQPMLNTAHKLIRERQKLTPEDIFELGENRLVYGKMKTEMDKLTGQGKDLARDAFVAAIGHYETSRSPNRSQRIAEAEGFLLNLAVSNTPDQTGKAPGSESQRSGSSANN